MGRVGLQVVLGAHLVCVAVVRLAHDLYLCVPTFLLGGLSIEAWCVRRSMPSVPDFRRAKHAFLFKSACGFPNVKKVSVFLLDLSDL